MVVGRWERGRRVRLSSETGVTKASVKETVDAVTSGGLATKAASNDVELVLVNKVRDTWEPYTGYLGWSVEKICGNMLEAKEFPEIVTACRIKLT